MIPEIYSNLSTNLLINVKQLFPSPYCKVMLAKKHVLDKQLFRSLRFNFMHYVQKNNLF